MLLFRWKERVAGDNYCEGLTAITLAACVDQRGGSHGKPGLYSFTWRHCQSLCTGLGAPILSLHGGDARSSILVIWSIALCTMTPNVRRP